MRSLDIRRLRWGVLGGARIAEGYVLPAIAASRTGTLQGVASRSPGRAERLTVGSGASSYSAYESLLADPQVDAVYICLPNSLHAEWSVRALEAGKAVLCEKPFVTSQSEADAVIGAAGASGILASEAFMYRYHPQFVWLEKQLENERFGRPGFVHASIGATPDTTDAIRWDATLGGGVLNDLGCYAVDVTCAIFGAEVTNVLAIGEIDERTKVDVGLAAALRLAQGMATVEASFRHPWISTPVEIWFTEARCRFDHFFNPATHATEARIERQGKEPVSVSFPGTNAYLAMIDAFTARWRGGSLDDSWQATAASLEKVRMALWQSV